MILWSSRHGRALQKRRTPFMKDCVLLTFCSGAVSTLLLLAKSYCRTSRIEINDKLIHSVRTLVGKRNQLYMSVFVMTFLLVFKSWASESSLISSLCRLYIQSCETGCYWGRPFHCSLDRVGRTQSWKEVYERLGEFSFLLNIEMTWGNTQDFRWNQQFSVAAQGIV